MVYAPIAALIIAHQTCASDRITRRRVAVTVAELAAAGLSDGIDDAQVAGRALLNIHTHTHT